jgi:Mlc titration factor MtfA (ptsG expression regulator)
MAGWIWNFLLLGIGVGVLVIKVRRNRERRRLYTAPFPEAWCELLKKDWPLYVRIPEAHRKTLHGYIQIFIAEKNFEGCGGLELTDEMKVLVAAQACLILCGSHHPVYPKLKSVLLYPHTFVAGGKGIFGSQFEEPSARLGESWQTGTVILSWNSVKGGAQNIQDGHNVSLHEFAHQLDQEDGLADGAPHLSSLSAARTWASVFQHEFKDFLNDLDKGRKTVIDDYGATNGAEFFATATEAFFEKPDQLLRKRPELYAELKKYYQLDPATWNEPARF